MGRQSGRKKRLDEGFQQQQQQALFAGPYKYIQYCKSCLYKFNHRTSQSKLKCISSLIRCVHQFIDRNVHGQLGNIWNFKHRRKSPWVPTLTGTFPKNALYDSAQSANSISSVLFMCSYTTAIVLYKVPCRGSSARV